MLSHSNSINLITDFIVLNTDTSTEHIKFSMSFEKALIFRNIRGGYGRDFFE